MISMIRWIWERKSGTLKILLKNQGKQSRKVLEKLEN